MTMLDSLGHTSQCQSKNALPAAWDVLEEARQEIQRTLGFAPERLDETEGKPIRFGDEKVGWVFVRRIPFRNSEALAVYYGNWRTGRRYKWRSWRRETLSKSDRLRLEESFRQLKQERREWEQKEHAKAAREAQLRWESLEEADETHPYLVRKRVRAHGLKVEEDRLVVPLRDIAGQLWSLQFIAPDGEKQFLPGGSTKGKFFTFGTLENSGTVLLCEGWATGATLHEVMGLPVVAAMTCGNLLPVARALKEKYPQQQMVICADDDRKTESAGKGNPGIDKAREAASAVGAAVAVPVWTGERGENDTDFNDLALAEGPDAVRAALVNPVVPEIIPEISDTLVRIPFPVDALPGAIRSAVLDVQAYTQAPVALVAASALTAVSIAAQGQADIRTHHWLTRPISLFLLTVASSGERKTTCDWFFTKPLQEFEREAEGKNALALKAYEAAMAAWSAKQRGLLKAIEASKRSEGGKAEAALSSKEAALARLYEEMPEKPPVPRLLYSDATTEALAYSITHSWPSAGLVSSEAGTVFGGYSMGADTVVRNLAMLNQLWDGADFSVDRRTKESFSVRNVRLTVGLQVQPEVLYSFMDRNGALSRGQGFLARFLLAFPESTQGTRIFKSSPGATPGLEIFQRRLRELLEIPLPLKDKGDKAGGKLELDPPVITLTPGAFKAWTDYYNRTERRLKEDLRGLTDVGSKAAEQVARLAAVFQVFERGVTDVEAQYVEAAAQIVDWYLLEAKRIYCETNGAIDLSDATRLERWLQKYCRDKDVDCVSCRDARHFSPVRDAKRFELAVRDLEQRDIAWVQQDGRRRVLYVNPAFLRQQPLAPLAPLAPLPVNNRKQDASGKNADAPLSAPLAPITVPGNIGAVGAAPNGASGASDGASGEAAQIVYSQQLQPSGASGASGAGGESENSPTPTLASGAGGPDVDKRAAEERLEASRQKLAANKGKTVCMMCGNVISECTCRRKLQDDNNPTIEAVTEPSLPGAGRASDARLCEACDEPMTLKASGRWECPSCL